MLEEESPRKKDAPEPRKLDLLGVAELKDYIAWLEGEIARVRAEIARKEAAGNAAAAFFKT